MYHLGTGLRPCWRHHSRHGKHLPDIVIISVILGISIILIYKPAPTAWGVCSTEGEREEGFRRGDKGQGSTVGSALETRL